MQPSANARVGSLALSRREAADALGVSIDFFEQHVMHELRIVRRGRRLLIPLRELERWLDGNAEFALPSAFRRWRLVVVPPHRAHRLIFVLCRRCLSGRGAAIPDMTDHELLCEVRRMRAAGVSSKGIARTLGLRPAVIAPLVRRVAAEAAVVPAGEGRLVGCWVSPGWSSELLVVPRDGWDDLDIGPDGAAGMALVLVARATRHDRVSVSGFLLDTFCLGVKNTIGPEEMRGRDLPVFVRTYFMAFPAPALPAPIELAQHLVLGSVAFADALGFSPHPDFEAVCGHLGELDGPCAITFGREGRPLYVAGPYDDPNAVMETLRAAVGCDGFAVAA